MRIGLIGAGAVAPLHARAAALIPGVEMAAVCDLDHSAAAKVADPIGANVFMFAQRYRVAEDTVTAAVAISTLLAVPSLALVIALLA